MVCLTAIAAGIPAVWFLRQQLDQQRLVLALVGATLLVVTLGSILGVILARRISRPLISLAEAASRRDLKDPIIVETELREVEQVARALESARVDLLHTLVDLKKERSWIDQLLESIGEGILTLDQDLRIVFFSQGAERITGWNKAEVLNRSCEEIFRLGESNASFSKLIPLPGQQIRLEVILAGDRRATLSFTGAHFAPFRAGEAQVALVFRDVSAEETVHRLLGHFLANVAHEFRTPLAALDASIELLLDQGCDYSAAELEELLNSLHLGILGLQTLVDNLLESANIETGHFRVSPHPSDLTDIIVEAAHTMQPLLEKYGQKLVLELPDSLPLAMVDPRRTGQVLINLLSNANKYGPADDEITLSVDTVVDLILVKVIDHGPGIPPGHRNDLFRRFATPDGTGANVKAGAGLGLSVIKEVVEAQGGQAGVDGRPGGGSIFWFTVPVASEA